MLAKIAQRIKLYKWPLLAGVFIGTSYAPFPPWAALFALTPLWYFWLQNRHSLGRILASGWLTGFVLTLIGFNWVAHTAQEFGHFPAPVAYLVLILYASFANIHIAVGGFIWYYARKFFNFNENQQILCLPLLLGLAQSHLQFLFHWNYGYSFLWVKWPIYQIAEIIGFQGISYLVLVFNAVFLIMLLSKKTKRLKLFSLAVAAFLALNLAGFVLQKSLPKSDTTAKVGIVQANIGNIQKQQAEKGPMFREHIITTYKDLSRKVLASGPADFIVWPETAFPSTVYPDGEGDFHVQELKSFVREIQTPLITGGYGYNTDLYRYTNTLFIIGENGEFESQQYNKTHLLAFGEFIPLADHFPILRKWIPAGNFLAGDGPKVLNFQNIKIGPQICYEGLYPYFNRELAQNGAQLIVNLTNDSWFGLWQEPFQHLIMTLARGIELRMPVIRSTNTGISTVMLADGEILHKTPLHKQAVHLYEVPYFSNKKTTIYQMMPWLMDLLFVCLFILLIWRSFSERIKEN